MKTRGVKLYNKFDGSSHVTACGGTSNDQPIKSCQKNKKKAIDINGTTSKAGMEMVDGVKTRTSKLTRIIVKEKVSKIVAKGKVSKKKSEIKRSRIVPMERVIIRKTKLKQNMRARSRGPNATSKCDFCDTTFSSESILERHKRANHKQALSKREIVVSERGDNRKDRNSTSDIEQNSSEQTDAMVSPHGETSCSAEQDSSTQSKIVLENENTFNHSEHFSTISSVNENCYSESEIGRDEESEKYEKAMELSVDKSSTKNVSSTKLFVVQKKLACQKCEKTFASKHSLDRHMKNYHENVKPHVCDLCPKAYTQKVSLEYHKQSHGENRSSCEKCGSVFKTQGSLLYHTRTQHTKKKVFQCKICDKTFCSSKSLENHVALHEIDKSCTKLCENNSSDNTLKSPSVNDSEMLEANETKENNLEDEIENVENLKSNESHSDEDVSVHSCDDTSLGVSSIQNDIPKDSKPYKCDLCEKLFAQKYYLKCHKETHNSEPLQCSICGALLKSKGSLYFHTRTQHVKRQQFQCNECGVTLMSRVSLLHHKKTHSEDRPYVCDKCGQKFRLKHTLNQHLSVHAETKPFKCDICQKSFTRKPHLNTHLLLHSSQKTFQCEKCGSSFFTKAYLKNHLLSHSENRPFKCNICESTFKTRAILHAHSFLHKEKSFPCEFCGKTFAQRNGLHAHLKFHAGIKTLVCDTCGHSFRNSHHLAEHKRIHTGEKPFVCDTCGKSFRHSSGLNSHIRTHSNARPYKCEICSKTFRSSGHLTEHKRTHSGHKPFQCNICEKRFARKINLRKHKQQHEQGKHGQEDHRLMGKTALDKSQERKENEISNIPVINISPDINNISQPENTEAVANNTNVIVSTADNSQCQIQCIEIGNAEESILMIVYPDQDNGENLTLSIEGDGSENCLHVTDSTVEVTSQDDEATQETKSSLTTNVIDIKPSESQNTVSVDETSMETVKLLGESEVAFAETTHPNVVDIDSGETNQNTVIIYQNDADGQASYGNELIDEKTVIIFQEQEDLNLEEFGKVVIHQEEGSNFIICQQETEQSIVPSNDNAEVILSSQAPSSSDCVGKASTEEEDKVRSDILVESLIRSGFNDAKLSLTNNDVTDEDYNAATCLSSILRTSLLKNKNLDSIEHHLNGNEEDGTTSFVSSQIKNSADMLDNRRDSPLDQTNDETESGSNLGFASEHIDTGTQKDCLKIVDMEQTTAETETDCHLDLDSRTGTNSEAELHTKTHKDSFPVNSGQTVSQKDFSHGLDLSQTNSETKIDCHLGFDSEKIQNSQAEVEYVLDLDSKESLIVTHDTSVEEQEAVETSIGRTGEIITPVQDEELNPASNKQQNSPLNENLPKDADGFIDGVKIEVKVEEEDSNFENSHCLENECSEGALVNKDSVKKQKTKQRNTFKFTDADKKHLCQVCGKKFKDKCHLEEHLVSHSPRRNHKCIDCDKTFKHSSSLRLHIKMDHKSLNSFLCDFCGSSFKKRCELRKHIQSHDDIKEENDVELQVYECNPCGKKFSKELSFKRHLERHRKVKSHICSVCQKGFYDKTHLAEHVAAHSSERKFKCTLCPCSFKHASSLSQHFTLKHKDTEKHLCHTCGKHFKDLKNLNKHQRIHGSERPYTCNLCDKKFKQSNGLTQHLKTHSDKKPHICTICNSTYRNTFQLSEHMRRHTGEKPYSCEICGQQFRHTSGLKRHKLVHTELRPYKCDYCENAFRSSVYLADHMRIHTGENPFSCTICGNVFRRKIFLKRHMKKEHEPNDNNENITENIIILFQQ